MQINVREMPNEARSNSYGSLNYQYTGVYYDPALDNMYFVDKPNNLVTGVCNAKRFCNNLDFAENTAGTNLQSIGISEVTMLKMIAIVQKPELAKDLV